MIVYPQIGQHYMDISMRYEIVGTRLPSKVTLHAHEKWS